jgi:multidrug efflux pump subunit AcrA (membrane-fusion protein)
MIGRIIRSGSLELKVPVEASDISWVKVGGSASIATEDGLQTWEGKVQRIGDIVNQTTQAIDVTIEIIPNQFQIYDGLYLKAEIPGGVIPESMEIDRSAVYNGSQVYTVENDSILKVRDINTKRINSRTVVFNGLEEGEMLVNEQLINAHNNMIVSIKRDDESSNTQNKKATVSNN